MNTYTKKLAIKVIKTMAQAALGVIGSSALLTISIHAPAKGATARSCTVLGKN